jgi:hypothetical protein
MATHNLYMPHSHSQAHSRIAYTNRDRAVAPAKQLRRLIRRDMAKLQRMIATAKADGGSHAA